MPIVLTSEEVAALLDAMRGVPRLVCMLQHGSGLRVMEALTVRVKNLDFGRGELVVRDGKGAKDRVTVLRRALQRPLEDHLRTVRCQHIDDLGQALGRVPMPSPSRASSRTPIVSGRASGSSRPTRHYTDQETGSGIVTTFTSRPSARRCDVQRPSRSRRSE